MRTIKKMGICATLRLAEEGLREEPFRKASDKYMAEACRHLRIRCGCQSGTGSRFGEIAARAERQVGCKGSRCITASIPEDTALYKEASPVVHGENKPSIHSGNLRVASQSEATQITQQAQRWLVPSQIEARHRKLADAPCRAGMREANAASMRRNNR